MLEKEMPRLLPATSATSTAAVIGPGETPKYWRVGFDDGHDHPSVPGRHITPMA